MSMHEIEGLVEDSVLLLNETNKSTQEMRELFYNLYRFQAMFDTGYTHFRVKDILQQNQFLLSLPLTDHPSYTNKTKKIAELEEAINKNNSQWLDDAICMRDEDSGELVVYFDYGSKLWQKLINKNIIKDTASEPKLMKVSDLAHTMMQEASKQKNDLLTMQWYVITSNCFAEDYVDEAIYKSFPEFIKDKKVNDSKALALKAGVKNYHERDGYLTKQSWKEEQDLSGNDPIDKQFVTRFWLDLETTKNQLIKAYEAELAAIKELNKNNKKQKKIDFITDELSQFLNQENGWVQVPFAEFSNGDDNDINNDKESKTQWLWYKDSSDTNKGKLKLDVFDDDYYRQLIKVEFDEGAKGIYCKLGLQFGKILRWQKQQSDANPVFWHFKSDLLRNFDFDNPENEKLVNFMGIWNYPLSASNKKLKESLSIFSDYLKNESENISQFALNEFNYTLFERDCDQLMDVIDNGEPGTGGVIPDYAIFDLAAMIPLLFLFNAIDQVTAGDDIKSNVNVEKYFAKFKKAVSQLHPKGASKLYLETKCDLDTLIKEGMPAVVQIEFIQHYRKQLDGKNL